MNKPLGPYSPAVRAGDWVIVSGQLPIDPETATFVGGNAATQTARILENMAAILDDCGLSLTDVAKTTIFLTDLADFPAVNDAYGAALGDHRPARATVGVASLPLGATVEIEAWVYAPKGG